MGTGTDWIALHCGKGSNFKTLARAAGGLEAGKIIYVDLAAGSDSGQGADWDHSLASVNYAYDQVTADGNDYVIVRGWKTETGTGVIASLDVAQTHLIGHAGILNPYFPEKGSFYRSGAGDAPHTRIANEFIEVAGLAFNAVQGAGTESSSVSKGALEINDYLDANVTADANKAYVHGCYFPDWNSATTVTGLTITGAHYPIIHDCVFDSVYGNIDSGIYICGADDSNSALGSFENLTFRGAMTQPIKCYGGSSLQNSTFDGITTTRSTYVVDFTSDYSSGYNTFKNVLGNMTAGNIFNSASTVDARDTLLSVMGSLASQDVYGTTIFPDT